MSNCYDTFIVITFVTYIHHYLLFFIEFTVLLLFDYYVIIRFIWWSSQLTL